VTSLSRKGPTALERREALRIAWALVASGLLLRIALSIWIVPAWERSVNVLPAPDQYPALARSLLVEHTLGYGPLGATPTTVRGPGFPAWLAVGVVLGGSGTGWLGLWGSLPGVVATGVLVFWIGRRFGALAAVVAGCVGALHPLPAFTAARVMGDDFYAALGLLGMFLWWSALQISAERRAAGLAGVAGLLFAIQTLTRPSGLIALLVAVAFGMWRRPRRPGLIVLLVVVSLAAPLAWSIRSSRLEGRPVFVQSMTAYNFWVGEGLDRLGSSSGPAGRWEEVLRSVRIRAGVPADEAARFRYITLTPREAASMETRLAAEVRRSVVAEPGAFLARWTRGTYHYWFRAQSTQRTRQYLVAALPVLVLAGLGAATLRGGADGIQLLRMLLAYVLLHNLAYAAVLPMARMSVQVYPAVAALAGLGAWRLGHWWKLRGG
jgi:hypothetical protein